MNAKLKKQQGFTLVELVVVIAIIGVLTAVAVPFIASHLGESKDRAYEVDRERFQQAVDTFFSRPSNNNFIGKPQYPIMGMSKVTGVLLRTFQPDGSILEQHDANHATGSSNDHTIIAGDLANPLRGTQGGNPKWVDDGNGIRDGGEEELLDNDAASRNKPGWHVNVVTREGVQYTVDSRDYFIDFDKLASKGLLDQVPSSASPDNRPQDPPVSFDLFLPSAGGDQDDNQSPSGLAISLPSTTAALWVVDDGSGHVFQYSLDGTLVDSFPLDGANGNPSGIATDGSSFLVLDKDDAKVYRYNLAGGPQGSFNVNPPNDGLEGITSDGTSIWILNVDNSGDGARVFQYSSRGTPQGVSFPLAPTNSAPVGITTDGQGFWILDGIGLVFRYDLTGIPVGDPFTVPGSEPGGIATDGSNVWIVDKGNSRIYPFGLDGSPPGPSTPGLYDGSYSWYVNKEGKVQSLFYFFPEQDKTGFQTAYP